MMAALRNTDDRPRIGEFQAATSQVVALHEVEILLPVGIKLWNYGLTGTACLYSIDSVARWTAVVKSILHLF